MKTLTLEPDLEQHFAALVQSQQRRETEILLDALRAYREPSLPDWVGVGTSKEALSIQDEEILRAEWR